MVPVLLSGFGRSGTTAFMALLGTDARVIFDRVYPFEHRYLTYLAKQAILALRCQPSSVHDAFRMCDVNNNIGTTPAWWPVANTLVSLGTVVSLSDMWKRFDSQLRHVAPNVTYYAEKSPHWLAEQLRQVTPLRVIHLVRDPRDVYLSVRSFAHTMAKVDASILDTEFDADHARDMAHQLTCFAEAERADRPSGDAMVLRYEDWVADNHAVAKRIGDWLGLQLDAASEDITRNLGRHRTTQDVASSQGRWRREDLPRVVDEYLLPALGKYGGDYNYDLPTPVADIVPNARRPHSDDAEWEPLGSGVRLKLRGPDAWMELLDQPVNADVISEVWISLRGTAGDTTSVYWCRDGETYDEERVVLLPFCPGPHVQVVRVPVGKHPMWTGMIHRLRVDICNGATAGGNIADVFWVRLVR